MFSIWHLLLCLTFEILTSLVLSKGAFMVPALLWSFTAGDITTQWQAKKECTGFWWENNNGPGPVQKTLHQTTGLWGPCACVLCPLLFLDSFLWSDSSSMCDPQNAGASWRLSQLLTSTHLGQSCITSQHCSREVRTALTLAVTVTLSCSLKLKEAVRLCEPEQLLQPLGLWWLDWCVCFEMLIC